MAQTRHLKITLAQRKEVPSTSLWAEVLSRHGDVSTLGKDRSVMILVPGGPGGNHSVYNEIKDELFKYADLILFDPRGCGLSDSSSAAYCTIDHYRDDIEAIRKYFDLDKIVLFGGSYGSMAALAYAVKYQDHLEKLILTGGSPGYQFLDKAKENLRQRGTAEQILAGEKLFAGKFKNAQEFDEFYKVMAPLYVYKFQSADSVPTTKSKVPYNIDVTNLGFGGFLRTFDYAPYLKNVYCKTMMIFGKNDWINDPSLAESMAAQMPNCSLTLLDECGHFIWRDQKEAFFKLLKNFLSSNVAEFQFQSDTPKLAINF